MSLKQHNPHRCFITVSVTFKIIITEKSILVFYYFKSNIVQMYHLKGNIYIGP